MWRDVGRLAAAIGVLLVAYTLGVALISPHNFLGWLNTLVSTAVSVFFALVIGLALFQYQTRETDRKKREDFRELLLTELGETASTIEENPSTIQVTKRTRLFAPLEFDAGLKKHYPSPLVVEEAIKSGLFETELTEKLQAIARLMYSHHLEVRDAVSSVPLAIGENPETARYGRAVESVIGSEGRVVRGCKEVMRLVESERGP